MAWTEIEWACGHTGEMQLYGPDEGRLSRAAFEEGRDCLVCWLIKQWAAKGDPRARREDRYLLASHIAAGKGIRIYYPGPPGVPTPPDATDSADYII